jgi:hypothetical protein
MGFVETIKQCLTRVARVLATPWRRAKSHKYADDAATKASKRMLDAAGVRYYQYKPTGRNITLEL